MKILLAWIGTQDLEAPDRSDERVGPICSALEARSFDQALLIANQKAVDVANYVQWLQGRTPAEIVVKSVSLGNPTDIAAIHRIAVNAIKECEDAAIDVPALTFHLSPGTWAMATVWTILSATRFPAELIQSSPERGVKTIDLPFEISAEILPKLLEPADRRLARLSSGLDVETFGDLIFRSPAMSRLVSKASKAASRKVPILIEGEAGTEKQVLASAIHESGPRRDRPFVSVNCSAIDPDKIDVEIFGSAESEGERNGALAAAAGGTLYLDEVEALPWQVQVRLQVLLDEFSGTEASYKGPSKPDVRIIAATRIQLIDAVAAGSFREELFFGLAVLVLKIPPLRERKGDLGPLIEMLLDRINQQSASEPGFEEKSLSPGAKNALLQRTWPGNLRELENSLRRAAVWSNSAQITEDDIWDAVFSSPPPAEPQNSILGMSIDEGVDLQGIIAEVAKHYIIRAIEHAEGNKTTAAKLVGLPSYQTLSNWMKKYDVV